MVLIGTFTLLKCKLIEYIQKKEKSKMRMENIWDGDKIMMNGFQ